MAKVHLAIGPFGAAACGKRNVDTTEVRLEVTCIACQQTTEYDELPDEADDG